MSVLLLGLVLAWFGSSISLAHDIPNARVDRTIQATLEPGRLRIDYQVGISELTLTQDLRQIIGELPGADRQGWFLEYGRVTGPLNAKGLLVTVDGEDFELQSVGFDLAIEGHPLYTFHFEAKVPPNGGLVLNDTNYLASEGTSRLALRPGVGVRVLGDDLPTDVTKIPVRPVWQLDKAEERRTRRIMVHYEPAPSFEAPSPTPNAVVIEPTTRSDNVLSGLLDRNASRGWAMLGIIAFFLGGIHAFQPGHGKTIVMASSLGTNASPARAAILGLATAIVHMTSVAVIAGCLFAFSAVRQDRLHVALARATGFLIAAIGCWKLGRHLAGYGEHEADLVQESSRGSRGILPLALAAGAVPCWDAVALVLVAVPIGQLRFSLMLLAAFSLGMASVLVGVGLAASRFRRAFDRSDRQLVWEHRFGIAAGLILAAIGVSLLGTG